MKPSCEVLAARYDWRAGDDKTRALTGVVRKSGSRFLVHSPCPRLRRLRGSRASGWREARRRGMALATISARIPSGLRRAAAAERMRSLANVWVDITGRGAEKDMASCKVMVGLAAGAAALGLAGQAMALDEVTFGTNWLAEAEHGGFYQAVADGTYEKYGLKVTIVQGGPQAANQALLTRRQDPVLHGRATCSALLGRRAGHSGDRGRGDLPEGPAGPHGPSRTAA